MLKKLNGNDAMSVIVSLYSKAQRGVMEIRETHCGIDIDNASRYYEQTYDSDYESLMWTMLNYLSGTKYSVSEYFSAEVDDAGLPVSFTINTDLDDLESRGIRYEFVFS